MKSRSCAICVYLELSDRSELLRRHQRHNLLKNEFLLKKLIHTITILQPHLNSRCYLNISNFIIGHVLKPKVKPEIMLAISGQADYVFPTIHFCLLCNWNRNSSNITSTYRGVSNNRQADRSLNSLFGIKMKGSVMWETFLCQAVIITYFLTLLP